MSCDLLRCFIYYLWCIMAICITNPYVVKSCLEEERLALLEIKAYMHSYISQDYGDFRTPWSENGERFNCCAWSMVRCDRITGRVTELDLSKLVIRDDDDQMNNPWLFNVTLFRSFRGLVGLNLAKNYINGMIEHDGSSRITSLRNLNSLNLDSNYPLHSTYVNVGSLSSLKELILSYCEIGEPWFPGQLVNLTELQVLDMTDNVFTGPIEGLCRLKNLQELYLTRNNFHGDLPTCLQNLSSLHHLDLSDNNFTGKFPKMLLNSSTYLDLSHNNFQGRVNFSTFANLSNLQGLQLSGNMFEVQTEDVSWYPSFQLQSLGLQGCNVNKPYGTIPKFLLHQHNLSNLDLSDNNLVGTFPTWLFNNNPQIAALYLSNNSLRGHFELPYHAKMSLQALDISGNRFHGTLPRNFGSVFNQLDYLNMSMNNFNGSIPASISQMTGLQYLDMSFNSFTGELPQQMLRNCDALLILQLSENQLEGEIIPEYMNLTNLIWLKLSNNKFSGTINEALKRSPLLNYLDVSNNNITGHLPTWVGNFSGLRALSMSKNNLQGKIPTEICELKWLRYLDLSQNNFIGTVPPCSKFQLMNYIRLERNSLTGPIPYALTNNSNLEILDLRENQLSGKIPSWISKLSSLQVLLLSRNNFRGQVPHELCQLTDIDILDLSQNNLSGKIPKCFGNLSFGERLIRKYNHTAEQVIGTSILVGPVDLVPRQEEVEFLVKNEFLSYKGSNLRLMSGLDLSCNNFTGVIPTELGDLTQVDSLNLSHNLLSGPIPESFSKLEKIESLDISNNHLRGNVPPDLVKLNFLEIFNVSYNNLTGKVPDTGQFANFDENNYLGNPGLYGFPESKCCKPPDNFPPTATKEDDDDDSGFIDMVDFFWSFGMSFVVMLLATIAVLCINRHWRYAWFDFLDWHVLWWLL